MNILLEELSTSELLIVVNIFDVHTRSDHCCAGLAVVLLNKKELDKCFYVRFFFANVKSIVVFVHKKRADSSKREVDWRLVPYPSPDKIMTILNCKILSLIDNNYWLNGYYSFPSE